MPPATRELDQVTRANLVSWLLRSEGAAFLRVIQGLTDSKEESALSELMDSVYNGINPDKAVKLASDAMELKRFKSMIEHMRDDRHPELEGEKFQFIVPTE